MAADGKSLITSVGTTDSSVWLHDAKGDRQLTSEGDTSLSTFSSDGRQLYYLKSSGPSGNSEIWVTDLASGQTQNLLPGYGVESGLVPKNYAISRDGKRIALAMRDEKGLSHVWIASTGRRSSPQRLESQESEDSPFFLPDGDMIYRANRGGNNYLYTRKVDGSGEKKLIDEPILDVETLSPDGKWAIVARGNNEDEEHPYQVLAYPTGGGTPVVLCRTLCLADWDISGTHMFFRFMGREDVKSYFLATENGQAQKLPAGGVTGGQDLQALNNAKVVPAEVVSAMTPDLYSYSRTTIRRNLYRIPIP
jgi:eukaryotic-like serine/threonine-protein kinase